MTAAIVVTSISPPNAAMRQLAAGAGRLGWRFLVVGDTKSPRDFELPGCRFLGLEEQLDSGFTFARSCPTGHYARKNIGYLLAMRGHPAQIVETDDDNFPRAAFWLPRTLIHEVPVLGGAGWVNVYRYFTEANIWPRGLPLDAVKQPPRLIRELPVRAIRCPIQQGLADGDPDVDAVYRLLLPLPLRFRGDRRLAVAAGAWCPFSSQNTTWFPEAWPLLYLPSYCSFRMTDIWRSFIAQRIAWTNGWGVLFEGPTVWQERNEHDLMRDFAAETPGYLNNRRIAEELDKLALKPGAASIPGNLRACYRRLIEMGLVGEQESDLLEAWLFDLEQMTELAAPASVGDRSESAAPARGSELPAPPLTETRSR